VYKGHKPDFHRAMDGKLAQPFYEKFVELMRKTYRRDRVEDGVFGAMMEVSLVNDGPVTLTLESSGSSGESASSPKANKDKTVSNEDEPGEDASSVEGEGQSDTKSGHGPARLATDARFEGESITTALSPVNAMEPGSSRLFGSLEPQSQPPSQPPSQPGKTKSAAAASASRSAIEGSIG